MIAYPFAIGKEQVIHLLVFVLVDFKKRVR